ncbi:hypothetical protein Tco_0666354 [Tanacetum coccineum]
MKKEKINITSDNYSKLNKLAGDFGKRCVPQQELSAEQKFWLQSSDKNSEKPSTSNKPVKIEVPSELPKFDKGLHDEIIEVKTIFTQMEAVVEQCSVDRKCCEIQQKQFLIEIDRLLDKIISQEIMNIVLNSSIVMCDSVKKNDDVVDICNKCRELEAEFVKKNNAYNELSKRDDQNDHLIQEYFKQNDLRAQLQANDTVISKIKETIHSLRENANPAKVKQDIDEIVTINIELEHSVAKLLYENEKLHKEKEHLKKTYKELYDSIKLSCVHAKEQCDSLIDNLNSKLMENADLKAQIQEKVFANATLKNELRKHKGKNVIDTTVSKPNATTIAPRMFKLDLETLALKVLKNKDAHLDYIKHSREHADTLREIVESARALSPLDSNLNSAYFRISLDEFDDEDYTVIFDENSFSYKIISINDLKTNSGNDKPLSPNPTVDYFDDLNYFKDFEYEFPSIVYNDGLTSKLDLEIKPLVSSERIDEFNLIDEALFSEYDEEIVSRFNDLFNIIHLDDSKLKKDNDDNDIDIIQSSEGNEITHGKNGLSKTSHNKIIKTFETRSFVMNLKVNIVIWEYYVNGMLFFLIINLYMLFGIPFDPKRYYKDGCHTKVTEAKVYSRQTPIGKLYGKSIRDGTYTSPDGHDPPPANLLQGLPDTSSTYSTDKQTAKRFGIMWNAYARIRVDYSNKGEDLFAEYERFRAIGNESFMTISVSTNQQSARTSPTQRTLLRCRMVTLLSNNSEESSRRRRNVARQCKEPKRKMASQYFKDKALLMEAKEEKGCVGMLKLKHPSPNAAVAFMANLSSTSATNSQVNEVHSNDNQIFDNVNYQLSQEMHQEEQLDSDAETEIDDNTIPYHQYLLDTEAQNVPTEVSADASDKVSMIAILTDLQTQLDGHAKVNQEKCLEIETLKNELLQCKQEICRLDTHKVKLDLENKVRQEQALVIQRNKRNAELVQENDLLKSTLSGKEKSIAFLQSEKEKILSEKKDLADSYLDEIVCLKNANKVARDMLQRFNMPTQTIPMLSKKPKAATADLHKDLLGTRNPGLGYIAKRAQPVLYDADTLLHPAHHPVRIWDSEDVLVHQVVSMKKMNEKPGHVRPANGFYDKLNAMMFVPQKELSQEQVYGLSANEIASNASNPATPVTPFVHNRPPPSQVLFHLQKVNAVFHQFEGIINERTTQKPLYVSEWCFDYAKQFVEQQLVPFYDHFKKHIESANETIFKEVKEYEQIFDDLDAEYERCVLDNKNLTIEKKNLLIKNDCLIAECLEKDICSIVLTSDIVVPPSSNCLCEDLRSACDREHTKVLELEAEVLKQQKMVIESEKHQHLHAANETIFKEVKEYEQIFDDLDAEYERCVLDNKNLTIEKKNILIKNDCLIAECLEKDICSIVLTSDIVVPPSSNCLCEDLRSACNREHTKVLELEAEVLASGMYTNSSKYVPPPKRANWVKPTPLPKKKQVTFQEPPKTSNRPTQKPPVQQNKKPNVPVNLSTRTKPATVSRKPMPKCHTRNHRILPNKSVNARRAAKHKRN